MFSSPIARVFASARWVAGAAANTRNGGFAEPKPHHIHARHCSTAAASGFNAITQAGSRLGVGGLVLGSGSVLVYAASNQGQTQNNEPGSLDLSSRTIPWVAELESSAQEMLNPGQMLRKHPIAKIFVDQDHLFETMRTSSQIKEFRCFYENDKQIFHSVVQLGKDVCGFPQTVHGGLTAAIIDETFGGLGICCWRAGRLGFRLPAYTARLEVDYKKKLPSSSLILCSAELERVEGRKVWMVARVTDGKGNTFATARALFVAPRLPGEGIVERVGMWLQGGNSNNGRASSTR